MCHVSRFTCSVSPITCHLTPVTYHLTTTLCSFGCHESTRRLGDAAAGDLVFDRVKKNKNKNKK